MLLTSSPFLSKHFLTLLCILYNENGATCSGSSALLNSLFCFSSPYCSYICFFLSSFSAVSSAAVPPGVRKPGLQDIKGQINFLITLKLPDLIDGLAGMFLIKLPMCLVQTLSSFRQEQRRICSRPWILRGRSAPYPQSF